MKAREILMTIQSRLAFRFVSCSATLLMVAWTCAAQTTTTAEAPPSSVATPEQGPSDAKPDKPEQKTEQAPETPVQDGFRMGAFTFKPGGRVKLDVLRDFE